ncbi:cell division protein FtsZ [Bacteroidia bacterium]|nr:cell division protein FtsZ [Bacteroidia bacterium]
MDDTLKNFIFDTPPGDQPAIIKVVGVGGGGGNAVKNMYTAEIKNVTFALCNTDRQALLKSAVPTKLQLGKELTSGLGAGAIPEVGRLAAEESIAEIQKMLSDDTKMVLVTAGMGGGTGTGAAPVIARVAKGMGLLTVGIVTIPFLFEGTPKIVGALKGVEEMKKNVDALLVINNELLPSICNASVLDAYKKADEVLASAAKSIAEIITIEGYQNLDFADVKTTLENGGIAVMNNGFGSGEERITQAFNEAITSPLLNNNDIFLAKKILFNIYSGKEMPLGIAEMKEVTNFMSKFDKSNIELIWGLANDDDLGEKIKITILASGYGTESLAPTGEIKEIIDKEMQDAEEEKKRVDTEQKDADKALVEKYYVGTTDPARVKEFTFKTFDELDDDALIEALLNSPAYGRRTDVSKLRS